MPVVITLQMLMVVLRPSSGMVTRTTPVRPVGVSTRVHFSGGIPVPSRSERGASQGSSQQGDRIAVDPRREFRERQETRLTMELEARQLSDPPPGLLDGPGPPPTTIRSLDLEYLKVVPGSGSGDGFDPYQDALRLQSRPGRTLSRRTDGTKAPRVRVYHRLTQLGMNGQERCWAFTLSRGSWERLLTERILDSDGATYPDGTLVVSPGVDPLYVPLRCGSCGTTAVECLQMEFFEDSP